MTAYSTTWKLALVIKINYLSGSGCLSANLQHLLKTSLIWWNSLISSGVMIILSLFSVAFRNWEKRFSLSAKRGM